LAARKAVCGPKGQGNQQLISAAPAQTCPLTANSGQALHADPFAGEVFIFRPKRADRVKILVYDGTGLCLYAKRLEAGRFCWPSPAEGVVRLSSAQLATLLESLPWHRLQPRAIPRPSTAW
jgi:transposase